MTTNDFHAMPGARQADQLFTLTNAHGMCVTLSERGAALRAWLAPDRYGRMADVLLGYADPADYLRNADYFGAIIGRWANRIGQGRFVLDGAPHQAAVNDRGNHLHGGEQGFHAARWRGAATGQGVRFMLTSAAGEGGFPGRMEVQVDYRLDDAGRLTIDYRAESDAPTPVNLTAHPYFNLNGGVADVGDHMLQFDAGSYLQTDATGIPVARASVAGTPFDFRQPAAIGPRLAWPDAQLALAGGFDHYFCLDAQEGQCQPTLREVARVYDPGSGRTLQLATTEAGLQFYSGNKLAGVRGKGARPYRGHDGFCLEAHASPNQINGAQAGAVVLRPGAVYRQTTVYQVACQGGAC